MSKWRCCRICLKQCKGIQCLWIWTQVMVKVKVGVPPSQKWSAYLCCLWSNAQMGKGVQFISKELISDATTILILLHIDGHLYCYIEMFCYTVSFISLREGNYECDHSASHWHHPSHSLPSSGTRNLLKGWYKNCKYNRIVGSSSISLPLFAWCMSMVLLSLRPFIFPFDSE